MWWLKLLSGIAILALAAATLFLAGEPLMAWAASQQRALQQELAVALSAIRRGDTVAITALLAACVLYGVVHAIGPGHGKLLIGGAAVASQRTARRMAGLGLFASLAQGITAIVVVYGGFGLLSVASRSVIQFSETWLTAASYGAIALVGLWLVWRGLSLSLRLLMTLRPVNETSAITVAAGATTGPHHHHAGHRCGAGCKHLPTVDEIDQLDSWRDALALIVSIGLRPCSGALIVLALSWRYDLYAVGIAASLAMALGTGVLVACVAILATGLRKVGPNHAPGAAGIWSAAITMLVIGVTVTAISLSLVLATLNQDTARHPLAQLGIEETTNRTSLFV